MGSEGGSRPKTPWQGPIRAVETPLAEAIMVETRAAIAVTISIAVPIMTITISITIAINITISITIIILPESERRKHVENPDSKEVGLSNQEATSLPSGSQKHCCYRRPALKMHLWGSFPGCRV